jgi:phospholipid N-methyltransferase
MEYAISTTNDFTNEHVKETSAQNADAIIPEVPQTDTNEHVKETSAQNADAIITEVPQTNTNEHVNEVLFLIGDIYLFVHFHRCRPGKGKI